MLHVEVRQRGMSHSIKILAPSMLETKRKFFARSLSEARVRLSRISDKESLNACVCLPYLRSTVR